MLEGEGVKDRNHWYAKPACDSKFDSLESWKHNTVLCLWPDIEHEIIPLTSVS